MGGRYKLQRSGRGKKKKRDEHSLVHQPTQRGQKKAGKKKRGQEEQTHDAKKEEEERKSTGRRKRDLSFPFVPVGKKRNSGEGRRKNDIRRCHRVGTGVQKKKKGKQGSRRKTHVCLKKGHPTTIKVTVRQKRGALRTEKKNKSPKKKRNHRAETVRLKLCQVVIHGTSE